MVKRERMTIDGEISSMGESFMVILTKSQVGRLELYLTPSLISYNFEPEIEFLWKPSECFTTRPHFHELLLTVR